VSAGHVWFSPARAKKSTSIRCLQAPREMRLRTVSNNDPINRRDHERVKVSVPVEIKTDTSPSPIRGATSDMSLTGCYIETIYPFPVGTHLDLQLSIGAIVLVAASVVTCDPQVGNGIRFSRMLAEDSKALEAFLEAAQQPEEDADSVDED
jgi:hypothetical protein